MSKRESWAALSRRIYRDEDEPESDRMNCRLNVDGVVTTENGWLCEVPVANDARLERAMELLRRVVQDGNPCAISLKIDIGEFLAHHDGAKP